MRIQRLYHLLYALKPTPVVALNRAIAVGYASGPEAGLRELEQLPDLERLKAYPFYPAARAEFHRRAGRLRDARAFFEQALKLARNPAEARFLERKLQECSLGGD